MRTNRKSLAIIAFVMLSIGLFSQEQKSSPLSYSLSYLPPYLISSEGDFSFFPIYTNFEANIHYKPFDLISFSSGLGFFRYSEEIPSYYIEKLIEYSRSYSEAMSSFRIPLQANYHFVRNPKRNDSYVKATFINRCWIEKVISYESDGIKATSRSVSYLPSVGLGIGAIFFKEKSIGLLLEGTVEKFLRFHSFTNSTMYSLKVGILI
ncbi:MAG: hypothetical protein ABFS32_18760 [Bacteroidota bacterium]